MSTDLYQRPSRDEIATRVNASLPGKAKAPDALACFATHLRARMRALGWDAAHLVEKTGVTQITITKAVNGSAVSLELAGKLGELVGMNLRDMLGPYVCSTCEGAPPAGFACLECDTEGERR